MLEDCAINYLEQSSDDGIRKLKPSLDETVALLLTERRLDRAEAPRGGEVVQTLDPGIFDLLARMSATVGDSLMPLVPSLGRYVKTSEAAGDRRLTDLVDRTLKNLDQMKDLVAALRKMDTRGIRTQAASQGE